MGQVERRPDGRLVIALDRQPAEPVDPGQFGHMAGDGLVGVQDEVGGGDAQCQWQVPAQAGQVGGGVRLRLDPRPQKPAQ